MIPDDAASPPDIEALPLERRASAFAALLDRLRTELESDGRG